MNSLFRACSASILSTIRDFLPNNSVCRFPASPCKLSFGHSGYRTVNFELQLTRFRAQCYSSGKSGGSKSRSRKMEPKPAIEEEMKKKNEFFVVRKGDIVGVYNNLSECQAQVGSSICDPPVSVYKGYSMPQATEEYLISCGLKDALFSIRAADLKEDLFGPLVPCPFQHPSASHGEIAGKDVSINRPLEAETAETVVSPSISTGSLINHVKRSCILEFDGASKGNPGQAGAGAVLRADDGSVICKVREGLGIATNNAAEYRAIILGLRCALRKGFTNISVVGDSKLVCMQMEGLWKVKHQNMSDLYEEAKKLKNKFLSFKISHVLRGSNADADAQANLAVSLADGQIQEEFG